MFDGTYTTDNEKRFPCSLLKKGDPDCFLARVVRYWQNFMKEKDYEAPMPKMQNGN